MPVPATVVVNAAGLGSRLGLNLPKALLQVEGRPLISWQLSMLQDVPDVRIVLGYRAAEVAEVVFGVRRDVTVVLNHDFSSTGTAASFLLGARGAAGQAVSLDCDLLVHPADLAQFVASTRSLLGVLSQQSVDPVLVQVAGEGAAGEARRFGREPHPGWWEWSGLVSLGAAERAAVADHGRGHVFEMIAPLLPMPVQRVRAREVDYEEEVEEMVKWIREMKEEGVLR